MVKLTRRLPAVPSPSGRGQGEGEPRELLGRRPQDYYQCSFYAASSGLRTPRPGFAITCV